MKRLNIIIIIIVLLLCTAFQAAAMSRPQTSGPTYPIALPYKISGEDIVLDSYILDFDLQGNVDYLTQKLYLHNSSVKTCSAKIAIQAVGGVTVGEDMQKIQLDGENVKPSFRFADIQISKSSTKTSGDTATASMYSSFLTSSIRDSLTELNKEEEYVLSSFDDQAPLSGYNYEITCAETGSIRLILTYDPEQTKLLIDPGDAEREYGKIDRAGYTYSRKNGVVDVNYYMEKGEKMNCRVLILGSNSVEYELNHWPSNREPDANTVTPGVEVRVSSIEGITPFEFYNDYIHKYDDEDIYQDTYRAGRYKNEIANRQIDQLFRSGESYIDCLGLSSNTLSSQTKPFAIIEFDIAAGETRQLEVSTRIPRGFEVSDDRKTAEYFYLIFTEPLDSFGGEKKTEVIIRPPMRNYGVSIMPELSKTAEQPLTYEYSGELGSNIVVLYNAKYKNTNSGLIIMIFSYIIISYWPIILAIVIGIITAIYIVRKNKQKEKPVQQKPDT